MTSVLLASATPGVARTVRLASDDNLTVILPEQVPVGPAQLLALAPDPDSVTTVMLDTTDGQVSEQQALDLARRVDEQGLPVGIVLVTTRADDLALPALRVGVRDLLAPDAGVEDVRVVLRRNQDGLARRGPADSGTSVPGGRLITVASPKGGVGKTTVSTNLALGLAAGAPQSTVLVDLDVQFGDVAAALDLQPTYTIADMISDGAVSDLMGLKALLTVHDSGLQVVCGVASPDEADTLTPSAISTLLQTLRKEYRYVVVDTAPGLTDPTLAALDLTTDLVLVTGLNVPSVRGLRHELRLLESIGLPAMTQHVVVNMADRSGGLTVPDVEATIGRPVDVTIPRSDKVALSTDKGVPIVTAGHRDRDARRFWELVSRFAPVAAGGRISARHRGWAAR